jgi:microprocessor complex subunit DGCR8
MHPHVQTWGSILRLYGSRVAESYLKNETENDKNDENSGDEASKEKLAVEQSQKAKPNKELLEKLKEEMRKIKKVRNFQTISKSFLILINLSRVQLVKFI